jgi:hypothetical protein
MTPEQFALGQERKKETLASLNYNWKKVREANGTLEASVLSGRKQVAEKKGIHAEDAPRDEWSRRGGETQGRRNVENKTGMFKRSPEELGAVSKKARSRRFRCLVTGAVSNDTGLTKIQRRMGIDTSLRIQIN